MARPRGRARLARVAELDALLASERLRVEELQLAARPGEDDGTDDEASLDGIRHHAQLISQRLRRLVDLDEKGRETQERGVRMLL